MQLRTALNTMCLGFSLLLAGACGSPAERAAEAGAEAQQLLDAGRYREAAARLDYAIGQRDDVPGLWLLLGRAKMAMRDAPGAYAAYRNALDQDPGSREALFALSQLSLAAGKYPEARDYAAQVLLLSPGEPNALVMQGFAALGLGRIADASQSAEAVLKGDPTNELGLTIKSMIAYRQGDYALAGKLLAGPLERGTSSTDVLRQLRRVYRRTADVQNLVRVTGRIAELQPDDAAARLDLAQSLYAAGDKTGGGRALLALGLDGSASRREAVVRMWMDGAVPAGELARDRAIQMRPWLRLAFAEFSLREGSPELALQVLHDELAAPATIENLDHQGTLASALLASGRRAEASARARAVLSIDPRQPAALVVRGKLALDRGDRASALRDARVVVADNPSLVAGYALLADTYRATGDMLLAEASISDLSNEASDSVDQLKYSILFFSGRSKLEQAASIAREFTSRNPLSRQGWKLRYYLCETMGDMQCVRRSSEFLRRLNGRPVDYTIAPENSGGSAEELFAN